MTTRQLALVDPAEPTDPAESARPASWRLDAHTREIGLRGVAEGRRILREAPAREAPAREAARRQERTSAA